MIGLLGVIARTALKGLTGGRTQISVTGYPDALKLSRLRYNGDGWPLSVMSLLSAETVLAP